MATLPTLPRLPALGFPESEFARSMARRIALARELPSAEAELGKPATMRLLAELDILAEPFRRMVRRFDIPLTARPQTVLVLPGFATSPSRLRFMARQLERAGHTAKRWGQGRNWGPTPEKFAQLEARLATLYRKGGRPVVLLGWSLGGLYARELATRHPQMVAKVITMGSPFSGSPRANNVWRVYQFITGHAVDRPPVEADVAVKPPVETVALWSINDGVIAPRCAAGLPGERDRAVALTCTHAGFTYAPETILAVLAELERA